MDQQYYKPDFLTGINLRVKRSGGRRGGAERRPSGGGGVQNVGYKSPVLSPVGCTR